MRAAVRMLRVAAGEALTSMSPVVRRLHACRRHDKSCLSSLHMRPSAELITPPGWLLLQGWAVALAMVDAFTLQLFAAWQVPPPPAAPRPQELQLPAVAQGAPGAEPHQLRPGRPCLHWAACADAGTALLLLPLQDLLLDTAAVLVGTARQGAHGLGAGAACASSAGGCASQQQPAIDGLINALRHVRSSLAVRRECNICAKAEKALAASLM